MRATCGFAGSGPVTQFTETWKWESLLTAWSTRARTNGAVDAGTDWAAAAAAAVAGGRAGFLLHRVLGLRRVELGNHQLLAVVLGAAATASVTRP